MTPKPIHATFAMSRLLMRRWLRPLRGDYYRKDEARCQRTKRTPVGWPAVGRDSVGRRGLVGRTARSSTCVEGGGHADDGGAEQGGGAVTASRAVLDVTVLSPVPRRPCKAYAGAQRCGQLSRGLSVG